MYLIMKNKVVMGYSMLLGNKDCPQVEKLPDDWEPCKYLFEDNDFKLNPDWNDEPPQGPVIGPTTEQIAMTALAQGCSGSLARIKTLEQAVTDLGTDYSSALKRISSLEKALTELTKSYGTTIVHVKKLEEKLGESTGDDGNEDGV